jgi:hypothetical protein
MQSGVNCLVTSYPDIEGVVNHLIAAARNPTRVASERETAQNFRYAQFHTARHCQLEQFLAVDKPAVMPSRPNTRLSNAAAARRP